MTNSITNFMDASDPEIKQLYNKHKVFVKLFIFQKQLLVIYQNDVQIYQDQIDQSTDEDQLPAHKKFIALVKIQQTILEIADCQNEIQTIESNDEYVGWFQRLTEAFQTSVFTCP